MSAGESSPTEVAEAQHSHVDTKAWTTLQARAALLGVALSSMEDDRGQRVLVCSKWAMVKQLETVAEVEALLRRIGGPNA